MHSARDALAIRRAAVQLEEAVYGEEMPPEGWRMSRGGGGEEGVQRRVPPYLLARKSVTIKSPNIYLVYIYVDVLAENEKGAHRKMRTTNSYINIS